jgi:hypothetical protein
MKVLFLHLVVMDKSRVAFEKKLDFWNKILDHKHLVYCRKILLTRRNGNGLYVADDEFLVDGI